VLPEAPALGRRVEVRYTGRGASGAAQQAIVKHVRTLRGRPWIGLALLPARAETVEFPAAVPAFATAACPWFFRETLRARIVGLGARSMTIDTDTPLLAGTTLDFDLHLAFAGTHRVSGRVTGARRVEFTDVPGGLAEYLLGADATLTPALLRGAGISVRSIGARYGYASSRVEYDEILRLRLRAHLAEGHAIDDMRSPFDAHARHLTCRFGHRIVGYVRVIFVDGVPERSQYVMLGGHEVPKWLWDEGFVEAGAGAIHPDFQGCGLFTPLMAHAIRVAVQSGHRYVLGACDDSLLGMYGAMGFEPLEQRIVEPRRGWRFRSHLIYLDAERATRTLRAAVDFAGLPVAA
jgi:GNAT superfamily N-acetyltransferase